MVKRVKVLHITTSVRGGAGIATRRLCYALSQYGLFSSILAYQDSHEGSLAKSFAENDGALCRIRPTALRLIKEFRLNLYRKKHKKTLPIFNTDWSPFGKEIIRQLPDCDVINLHWVAGFVDYTSFFRYVSPRTPVVWTLHDMNPFTGGCHYAQDCERYTTGCESCPQLVSTQVSHIPKKVWLKKKKIFDKIPKKSLCFISPSEWLARKAKKSPLISKFPVEVIPNSLDTSVFSRKNKIAVKELFGIHRDSKVVLFVADSLEDKRKGVSFLMKALRYLKDIPGLCLVSVGRGYNLEGTSRIRYEHLGSIQSERIMSIAYNIADVFILPSLGDNLPNAVMEAMACGVPVIAFQVGGIPEMIRHLETGYLARYKDILDLANGMRMLLYDDSLRIRMGHKCREEAVKKYSYTIQAEMYFNLYKRLLNMK